MSDRTQFAVVEGCEGERVRVSVVGDVDLATCDALRARLRRLRAQSTDIWLDLSQVEFMDCSGAHLVTDAISGSDEWRVELAPGASPPVRRLFELLRMESLLGPA